MIINEKQINECLAAAKEATSEQVLAILAKARAAKGLSLAETAVLLYVDDPVLLATLYTTAQEVKERIYGKRVVLFAPLYLSNECTNNCLYCAFRHDNKDLERRTLTLDELREQVLILEGMGHKRLLLESGEDLSKVPIDYVVKAIETIYATKSNLDTIRRVNVNVAATTVENYQALRAAGIGTYQLFQETYHRPTYEIMHPSGPKASYEYHLTAMDRAMQAGIDDVGLGVLFGLYDHRFEVLALLQHAAYLEKTYGVGPHTISVPRLRLSGNEPMPAVPLLSDEEFTRLVAVLRLAVPYTGIIMSTRESAQLRDRLLDLGVSQMSAASATSPGGYKADENRATSQQFATYDHRSLLDIVRAIGKKGYLPSFCTACYRVGRTGEHFMEFAKDGEIQSFCQPNAILTVAEYLADHGDEATQKEFAPLIDNWVAEINDPAVRSLTRMHLQELAEGKRDLYL